MHVLTLEKLAKDGLLAGKRVLIRSDLNAPHDENGPWAYRPTGRQDVDKVNRLAER